MSGYVIGQLSVTTNKIYKQEIKNEQLLKACTTQTRQMHTTIPKTPC